MCEVVHLDAVGIVVGVTAKAAAVELLQQRDEPLVLPDLLVRALCRDPAILQVDHLRDSCATHVGGYEAGQWLLS